MAWFLALRGDCWAGVGSVFVFSRLSETPRELDMCRATSKISFGAQPPSFLFCCTLSPAHGAYSHSSLLSWTRTAQTPRTQEIISHSRTSSGTTARSARSTRIVSLVFCILLILFVSCYAFIYLFLVSRRRGLLAPLWCFFSTYSPNDDSHIRDSLSPISLLCILTIYLSYSPHLSIYTPLQHFIFYI